MARRFAMARQRTLRLVLRKRALYLMMIPGIAFLFAFNYMPMYGAIIAFKDFQVKKGMRKAMSFRSRSSVRLPIRSITPSAAAMICRI